MKKTAAAFTGIALLTSASAFAVYPDRPVKLVVPWAAGGDTDNIFRPFAPLLQKHLDQPFFPGIDRESSRHQVQVCVL